ncbi:MAG: phage holin family protein [Myxococcota bacterium]
MANNTPKREPFRPTEAERSLGELLREMNEHSRELVRQEIELAKRETRDNADRLRRGITWSSMATAPALVALICLALAGIYALGNVLPGWAAALVIAAVLLLAAASLGWLGYRRLRRVEMPPRTGEALEKDQRWAREKLS